MGDQMMSGRLTMQWVPVLDDGGRTRMEARWSVLQETASPAPTTAVVTHAA